MFSIEGCISWHGEDHIIVTPYDFTEFSMRNTYSVGCRQFSSDVQDVCFDILQSIGQELYGLAGYTWAVHRNDVLDGLLAQLADTVMDNVW